MKKTFQATVQIEGIGQSKELAINTALGSIQKKIMSNYKGLILRIEPIDVTVIEARETTYTERFFLLFFPRKRNQYKVVLEVEVNVFLLDVEEIVFEKTDMPDNMRNMLLGNQINK
ncbi:DUF4312 family protein [Lysinibacillus piscis]|uniref:DUF4312 family protein n=1 Tax=Lysinibacillus piscis TaxID=2518931 RepID=A0ABQ5NF91_9BACI|nr:DUF4312 family protein [Lysinibacillus sp. KH24]GLC86924.1 hypothetical protein LYSBPC_00510 [Lysinibacillus sp. KH24]